MLEFPKTKSFLTADYTDKRRFLDRRKGSADRHRLASNSEDQVISCGLSGRIVIDAFTGDVIPG